MPNFSFENFKAQLQQPITYAFSFWLYSINVSTSKTYHNAENACVSCKWQHAFSIIIFFSDYELAEADQDIEDHQADETSEVKSEGREASFITGHRIPLELFSSATLRRIELIPEEEAPEVNHLIIVQDLNDLLKTVLLC